MSKLVTTGVLLMLFVMGCVGKETHTRTLLELEAMRKASTQSNAALEDARKQAELDRQHAAAEIDALKTYNNDLRKENAQTANDLIGARGERTQLQTKTDDLLRQLQTTQQHAAREMEALRNERARTARDLTEAQASLGRSQHDLDNALKSLDAERAARKESDSQAQALRSEHDKLTQSAADLKGERGVLQAKTEDLHRQLQTAQQNLAAGQKTVDDLNIRLADLEAEKARLSAALADVRNQAQDLTVKLAAEQAQATALREDKQKLMIGTMTAQEEIARLQKQAGQLETETARAEDLSKRLSERDQEIGRLSQAASDRETLAARLTRLTEELEQTKKRVEGLTADLAASGEDLARTKEERDRLMAETRKQGETLKTAGQELDGLRQAQANLQALLRKQEEGLQAEEQEKARLERERVAKEAEIQRLAKTDDDLAKALEAEIAKGDIRIQQVRDRLTINMVDRVLFDSGQAQVKPAGLKVLKQVSDILKNVSDKQIRIEGHTDNVPIGPKLRERFQTNWELSTARATTVVRFLIEEGNVDRSNLSASGYADTKPMAGNRTEEGRTSNRRIEIVLYPKELAVLAGQTSQ